MDVSNYLFSRMKLDANAWNQPPKPLCVDCRHHELAVWARDPKRPEYMDTHFHECLNPDERFRDPLDGRISCGMARKYGSCADAGLLFQPKEPTCEVQPRKG